MGDSKANVCEGLNDTDNCGRTIFKRNLHRTIFALINDIHPIHTPKFMS